MDPLPPGPRLPSIAQLVHMSMKPYDLFESCQRRYGDIFTLRLPGTPPTVFVADPEAVKWLTTAGYEDLSRFADLAFLLGDRALIFDDDEPHRRKRRLLMPPFRGERMRAYGEVMAALTDQEIAGWRDGQTVHLHDALQSITLRVIIRTVFGMSDTARMDRLSRLVIEFLDKVMTAPFYGATRLLGGARVRDFFRWRGRRMRDAPDREPSRWPLQRLADLVGGIDEILFAQIRQARALPAAELAAREDILALIVAARFEEGGGLDDEELRDQLLLLLLAGHETTATTAAWAVGLALQHPGTLERTRLELDATFAAGFDPAGIRSLDYLGAMLNESMRLRPIAVAVNRVLKRETTLAGHRLPAGTMVAPAIYLTQRHPRLWPEPTAYRPERFLEGKASVYEFFPFGAGPWRCLGSHFAEYEMRVILARLFATVDLTLAPEATLTPEQRGITVAPADGVPVRVHRRQQRNAQRPREAAPADAAQLH